MYIINGKSINMQNIYVGREAASKIFKCITNIYCVLYLYLLYCVHVNHVDMIIFFFWRFAVVFPDCCMYSQVYYCALFYVVCGRTGDLPETSHKKETCL